MFHFRISPFAAMAMLAVAFMTSLPVAAGAASSAPEIDQYTLDNGMRVLVIPDHRTPVVVNSVWYQVGGADDPYGKSGLAHFLEHLMFRGTKDIPSGEFHTIVARNGGQENAATTEDYTFYHEMVAKDRLPMVMKLEADRMVNLVLNKDVVTTERKVIIEERRSRVDNNPGALMGERMNAIQFLHHPYGTPLIGWLNEMQGLQLEDVKAFYNRYYSPTNAVLIVAGDVTGPEVLKLAKQYFGVLPRRDIKPNVRVKEPDPLTTRSLTFKHPDVTQPMWQRSYLAPSAHDGDTKLAPALEVLAQYLGSGTLSQLYQSLVVKDKIAASSGAYYDPVQKDLTTFGVYAVPVAGHSLDELVKAVDAEIDKVKQGHVDAAALARSKTLLKASTIYSRDSIMSMAQIYGSVVSSGLPVSYVTNWEKTIDAVTPDDLVAAAKAVLQPQRSVSARLLPDPDAAAARGPRRPTTVPKPGLGGLE